MCKCIAMVAGEASGDILGAGLVKALKDRYPNAKFIGIGGPKMEVEGFQSLYPMERLSVMGLVEVFGRLVELLKIRKELTKKLLDIQPDVFIGIDAPDFNIGLESKLKSQGIKTVHYVSPSVWTWREKRVFKIKKAVDLVLCLFPFEVKFYQQHNVKAVCVGHTLADQIDLEVSTKDVRHALALSQSNPVVAILPGSRQGEVAKLGELFVQTAKIIGSIVPDIQFIIPAANEHRKKQLEIMLTALSDTNVTLLDGQSRKAMAAADVVLMASGTATLESMLLKKPMVVSYKVSAITAFFLRRMLKMPYISLPNLLAEKALVPEILQEDATPDNLAQAVVQLLADKEAAAQLKAKFFELHIMLRKNADQEAAMAVVQLCK